MSMSKKERVMAALEGREADRAPVSFWRHITNDEGSGPALGRDSAQKHLEFYRAADPDFIKIMQDGFTAPFAIESIATLSDLRAIRPAGREHPFVRDYLERAKLVNELLRDEVYTWCNIFSPYMLLKKIGVERLDAFLAEDGEAVAGALRAIAESLCVIAEELQTGCGCRGVFACFQGAERYRAEDYRRYIQPSDRLFLDHANRHGQWNMAHFCAWDGGKNNLELWRDYPARVVNWAIYVDGLSLAEGRETFGGRTVMGGFDNRTHGLLWTGTRESVRAETKRIIRDYRAATGSDRGLILGADCSFLPPFEAERFRWVTDTIKEGC